MFRAGPVRVLQQVGGGLAHSTPRLPAQILREPASQPATRLQALCPLPPEYTVKKLFDIPVPSRDVSYPCGIKFTRIQATEISLLGTFNRTVRPGVENGTITCSAPSGAGNHHGGNGGAGRQVVTRLQLTDVL
jgi:hypothetical protein